MYRTCPDVYSDSNKPSEWCVVGKGHQKINTTYIHSLPMFSSLGNCPTSLFGVFMPYKTIHFFVHKNVLISTTGKLANIQCDFFHINPPHNTNRFHLSCCSILPTFGSDILKSVNNSHNFENIFIFLSLVDLTTFQNFSGHSFQKR